MRKYLLPIIIICCFFSNSYSQLDTAFLHQLQSLAFYEQVHQRIPNNSLLTVDSFFVQGNRLIIYFNKNQHFVPGDITEKQSEFLQEALANSTSTASVNSIELLAKDRATNTWKSLDFFATTSSRAIYQQQPNNDPYPNIAGTNLAASGSRIAPSTLQSNTVGGLQGKTVWLSPGHGYDVANASATAFSTQRGNTNEIVEDFGTVETLHYYLQYFLHNAGASVWSVREKDVNPTEIIVNNDMGAPAYSETGSWTDGAVTGYNGTYRVATATTTQTATATFSPTVTVSGYYWVSVNFVSGGNRPTDVKYTINHAGGSTTYLVNQEIHGSTWVYLGRFYFTEGANNTIVISNQSNDASQAVIADAVRLGSGIGQQADCSFPAVPVSNKSRFEESAHIYAMYQGYPTCTGDVTMRPRYAEWELSKGLLSDANNAVFVSFHTNAANAVARGTETYRYNGLGSGRPNITAGSTQLRDSIHKQIVADIRAAYNPTWADRGVKEANFGELRELNTLPGTLIELAFHDTPADATDLKNPAFRLLAARAIYKGIVKYFNYKDGTPIVFLPEEPTHVSAINIGTNKIKVTWRKPATGGILGDAATSYVLYTSTNGKGFSNGILVTDTTYTFTGAANTTYYFKVAAANAGGESFTSSVVAARTPQNGGNATYLIVDGFDRLSPMVLRNEGSILGNVRRMFLDRINRYDYMVDHAEALSTCGASFDGAQNEAVGNGLVTLSNYFAVDWFTGEESTADRSLDNNEITLLINYLDNGGNLLLSGSEIGWDIGRAASANASLNFYNNYLKANFIDDDANTYNFSGTSQFFSNQSGSFDNGQFGNFDVDFPDRIAANTGAEILLNYVGGTADGAAVGFRGAHKTVYIAFPIEAITNASVKNSLICSAVSYLTPTLPATGLLLSGSYTQGKNELTFITKSEFNTKQFEVEKSHNGFTFSKMGNAISAKGIANTPSKYSAIDANPLPTTYYRIKAIDVNGKYLYSNTIQLLAPDKIMYLVNNPAKNSINTLVNTTEKYTLQLSNSLGQVLYTSQQVKGTTNVTIPVNNFTKGMYLLQLITANKTITQKVIIE